ncbi:hypothetical protein FDG94_gp106 [Pseudomonas phage SM1]|uniref:Uncharacterized protein n=2 Tax=Samunavirus TaxID=2560221 RepID=A0A0U3C8T2_9CAUD|nr:hypothetical protein FDG94_gp106 [Pseudomonas phage SM1]ALT58098.1 hypothetical protein SM1_0106 [Pseudomonas phage SM1]WDS62465.1 hypothetical protein UFRH6_36 [Pseudomonas phage UF_RH6]HBO9768510.1 hypothetical protein [Pseudomonas aeruginosa]
MLDIAFGVVSHPGYLILFNLLLMVGCLLLVSASVTCARYIRENCDCHGGRRDPELMLQRQKTVNFWYRVSYVVLTIAAVLGLLYIAIRSYLLLLVLGAV